jgi:hypothetical protein
MVSKQDNYVVVDFLDIETSKISFGKPKPYKSGAGERVDIKYDNKQMYVRYEPRMTPFGASPKKVKVAEKDKGIYVDDCTIGGYTIEPAMQQDYEQDPYFQKALELDDFFIQTCLSNKALWGFGGPGAPDSVITGFDEKGYKGKWKRMIRYSGKLNKDTKVMEYSDYPPRLSFKIGEVYGSGKYHVNDRNLQYYTCNFLTKFFDANGSRIQDVTSANISDVVPKYSRVGLLAKWEKISLGAYGASFTPLLHQVRVFPADNLDTDVCLLDEDGENPFSDDQVPPALGEQQPVKVQKVEPVEMSAEKSTGEDEEDVIEYVEEDGVEEVIEEEVEEEVIEEEVEEVEEKRPTLKRRVVAKK